MHVAIRTIGNSKGFVLPKPILAQVGMGSDTSADLSVEDGALVLRKLKRTPRQGWAEAAQALAAQDDDALLMGEFGNAEDAELVW